MMVVNLKGFTGFLVPHMKADQSGGNWMFNILCFTFFMYRE
jgi:hypothetical protein